MNSTILSKWPYLLTFLIGITVGAFSCWVIMKIRGTLSVAEQMKKEIIQNLATGKSGNSGEFNDLQDIFPTFNGISGEKIKRVIENLGIGKQNDHSVKDEK